MSECTTSALSKLKTVPSSTRERPRAAVPIASPPRSALAYAIINPAIGLGTFLAQYFLSKPIAEASTRVFRVTGPWDDPKVERVERNAFAAPSPVETPAASATAEPPKSTTR